MMMCTNNTNVCQNNTLYTCLNGIIIDAQECTEGCHLGNCSDYSIDYAAGLLILWAAIACAFIICVGAFTMIHKKERVIPETHHLETDRMEMSKVSHISIVFSKN